MMFPSQKFFPRLFVMLVFSVLINPGSVLAAGQVFWDWPAAEPFQNLNLQGVAVDEQGTLIIGPSTQRVGPLGAEVSWRVLADGKGGFFTGTGHGGEIHHTNRKGESKVLTTLNGAEVFSLWLLADGGLLAGCGPDGHLYRISADGDSQLLGQVPGGYVWSLSATADDKTIYLAAGNPAAVYRYTDDEGLVELISLPAQNALDLRLEADGSLLVCTQGPGLVYRVDPAQPKQPWLICETPQDEVRQFVQGPDNQVFFLALNEDGEQEGASLMPGNSGKAIPPSLMSLFGEPMKPQVDKAVLYRLDPDGRCTTWWAGSLDLMIVRWDKQWGWLGGGPLDEETGKSRLFRLLPEAGSYVLAQWQGGDILDLGTNLDHSGGELLVAQAHPGGVRLINGDNGLPHLATSPPLDAGSPVQWGRLGWEAVPGKGKLRWSVRCGNRSVPDETWTPWSDSWSSSDQSLELPTSQFLQWRVQMPDNPQNHWRITSVSVSAWQDNAAPVVRRFTIEKLSEISQGGLMGSSDNVTQSFESGLRVEFGRKSSQGKQAGARRAAFTRPVRIMTWQGSDPNNDRLVYQLEYRRQGDESWRDIMGETLELLGSWDTSEVPDGNYDVRLTVSDRRDNPGSLALSSQREAGPLLVDNTPPSLDPVRVEKLEGGLRLRFRAQDEASVLAQATVTMPDGRVQRLDPTDRICDSRREEFDLVLPWPETGRPAGDEPWRLRVEVWDLNGNSTRAEGEAR